MKKVVMIFLLCCVSWLSGQNEEILSPVAGCEVYYLNDHVDWIDGMEMIKVETDEDIKQVRQYLFEILRDRDLKFQDKITLLDMLTGFPEYEGKTAYVFISPNFHSLVYTAPILKNNKVWLDAELMEDASDSTISLWIFYFPSNKDLRIRLDGESGATEFGSLSFVPDRFKQGTEINQVCGDLKIIAYGEYYEEPFYIIQKDEIKEYVIAGFKHYTDEIHAEIGTTFGLKCEYIGETDSSKEYTVKIFHPAYTTGPQKGVEGDSHTKMFKKGGVDYFLWEFMHDYELVPGKWEMQVFDKKKKIYSKTFQIHVAND
jgi:hypothetical protein